MRRGIARRSAADGGSPALDAIRRQLATLRIAAHRRRPPPRDRNCWLASSAAYARSVKRSAGGDLDGRFT
jgi:hypothetical protein